jgi:hypothetical protein
MQLTDHQLSTLAMFLLGTPYPLDRACRKLFGTVPQGVEGQLESVGYFRCGGCSVWRSVEGRAGKVCEECA